MLKEINGYTVADRKPVKDFTDLKDDGTTACGCWIYTGVYPEAGPQPGAPRAATADDRARLGWGFAWPANRRILYNRASADPEGKPWSERKKLRLVGRRQSRVDRPRRARLQPAQAAGLPAGLSQTAQGMDAHPAPTRSS